MNAVEIEEAVSELASVAFDAGEFPFAFLTAFGNRQVTVQRLRAGSGNASDVAGGVLQRNNIHMAVCAEGGVSETVSALRASPKTATNKVKFVLATDGITLEAEELASGDTLACDYPKFADHFGFFLPLAGISTVAQIKDNPVDIKATGRLNKLYVELLKDNPDWATPERRHDLNHFMARLIFCMFAEDTGIFLGNRLFSATVERMSENQSSNTHEVIAELFRAMNTKIADRAASNFRPWADALPYVNGGLFSGSADCPRFSRIARSYLLRAAAPEGVLTWAGVFHALADHYAAKAEKPFSHIVVDEAQDLGVPELRLLCAIAPEGHDRLFFAGDLGQRIFQQPFSWKALGADVRGRSTTLKVNYRTSHQIRQAADRLLPPMVRDVDGREEERRGTISVFEGPSPQVVLSDSETAETERVAAFIHAAIADGLAPTEIGIFVRSRRELPRARAAVQQAGLAVAELSERLTDLSDRVAIGTMHLAKGLEFKAVAVMACDDEVLPSAERIDAVVEESDLDDVYETERHLLYVACTRARDRLLISGVAPGSEFLADMRGEVQ